MLHRKVNIFFLLALVSVFIIFGDAADHRQILFGALFAFLLAAGAFLLNWLTLDGTTSAVICGSIAYGIGGIPGAAIILVFFISSSLLSKNLTDGDDKFVHTFRRDGVQVWSNGFWFSFWILVWFLTGMEAFILAGTTSIAVSTADTWATEIGGNRLHPKTWLLTSGESVQPGTDGGISVPGTIASLLGASVISLTYWIFNMETHVGYVLIVALTGFSGCIFDSYLGARFQQSKPKKIKIIGSYRITVSNNFVNWISSGTASILSMILTLIISL